MLRRIDEIGKEVSDHPNLTLFQRVYETFTSGDMDALGQYFARDVVWHTPGEHQLAGTYRGQASTFESFAREFELSGGTYAVDVRDVLANDAHIVALLHCSARRGGRVLDQNYVIVFQVRDGAISEAWEIWTDQGSNMSITVRANPTRITWDLFRPVDSIPGTSETAQINPEMPALSNLHPQRTPTGRFRLPSVTLTVGVNRQNTLVVKTAKKTNELLQHEQGHYDLLILVTRALARELESIDAASVQDLTSQIGQAMTRHDERAQAIDAAYDRQTEHHRNRPEQSRWDAAIAQALRDPEASRVAGMPL